ncbi:MAG: MmcB family DNA repair protein [Pseudomonadota bacterium]
MKDLLAALPPETTEASARPLDLAGLLARGITRTLAEHGIACLPEFVLGSGRRADLTGLDRAGKITIVEIKTSLADYRADHKWPEYLDYCDSFYFAVPEDFTLEALPEDCGLMVADGFGAAILRPSPSYGLSAARRRAESLRFARVAAERLGRLTDPR